MKLPNAHLAVVDLEKVTAYLLNAAHPDNGGKARFFRLLGYTVDAASELVNALCGTAIAGDVTAMSESAHGRKYVVDGSLASRVGKLESRTVRTVWIVDAGLDAPRLVTAYPLED